MAFQCIDSAYRVHRFNILRILFETDDLFLMDWQVRERRWQETLFASKLRHGKLYLMPVMLLFVVRTLTQSR